jgi:hypothetical protein
MSQAGSIGVTSKTLPPDVATTYIANVGSATPVAHVLNVLGVGGVTTTASGNTIDINVISTGFTWNVVTSISPPNPIQIVASNGYICTGGTLVTFLLPLAPSIGDSFIVASLSARFQINENGGQIIMIGANQSTAGSGNVKSNTAGDFIELVYVGSNIFMSFAPQGTITLN